VTGRENVDATQLLQLVTPDRELRGHKLKIIKQPSVKEKRPQVLVYPANNKRMEPANSKRSGCTIRQFIQV